MPTRLSTFFLKTLREDPADAEVTSHKLLVRAGYIRRQAPGIFAWLPLGLKVKERIERIIREMPYIDETDKHHSTMDVAPDCYEPMIDQHFQTRYRNCDYNINHFFSGRIRELRFYETCY